MVTLEERLCQELPHPEQLHLAAHQLTGNISQAISAQKDAKYMSLSFNKLTGIIPREIGALTNLRKLHLNDNELTGAIPPEISALSNLDTLELANNQLSGIVPPEITVLYNLKYLYLNNNQLYGTIPPTICALTNLKRLNLANNQLTGVIPVEIGLMTPLKELSLSGNELVGVIPGELGALIDLETLHLSNNHLTEGIPSEVCRLTSLERLHLADNNLTGPIPPEFGALTNLKHLDLSNNPNLYGVVRNLRSSELENTRVRDASQVLSHLPAGSSFQCAWLVGRRHLHFDPVFEVEDAMRRGEFMMRPSDACGPWPLWIALWRWLLGWEPQQVEQPALPAMVDMQAMVAYIHSVMNEPFHGNLLHLIAYYDLPEEALPPEIQIPRAWIVAKDYFGRTPGDILRRRARNSLSKHSRCETILQRIELEEMMVHNAVEKLDAVSLRFADFQLGQVLYDIVHNTTTVSIQGSLLQVRSALSGNHHNFSPSQAIAWVQCREWIEQAMMLQWSGVKSQDPTFLASVERSLGQPFLSLLRARIKVTPLNALCQKLGQYLREEFISSPLKRKCQTAYHQVIEWCDQFPKQPIEGAWLHAVGLRSTLLTPEAEGYLMPDSELVKENDYGHHVVVAYQGMHFKYLKDSLTGSGLADAPGVEFMVNRLTKLVVGHGTAPSRLVKFTRGDREMIAQVSKSVEGASLEQILLHRPDLVTRIDLKNMADMVLISMLTNPQDGKPDNYMMEIEYKKDSDGVKQVKALHLVGIDNDLAFGDPVHIVGRASANERFVTHVRNVVYLLPAMDEPINQTSRDLFLHLSPDLVLLEWLRMIGKCNEHYNAMLEEGVFTAQDFAELELPIRLPEHIIPHLHHTMTRMQKWLRLHPQSTLHSLLAHVEPSLAHMYQAHRQSGKPILDQIYEVYGRTMESQLGKDKLNLLQLTSRGEQYTEYSRLLSRANKAQRQRRRQLSVAQTIEQLFGEVSLEPQESLKNHSTPDVSSDAMLWEEEEKPWEKRRHERLTKQILEKLQEERLEERRKRRGQLARRIYNLDF